MANEYVNHQVGEVFEFKDTPMINLGVGFKGKEFNLSVGKAKKVLEHLKMLQTFVAEFDKPKAKKLTKAEEIEVLKAEIAALKAAQ